MAATWTRITDPEHAAKYLPAWIGTRMIGLRGAFGFLLASGDVLRCTMITALYQSSDGVVLLDVLLDSAGVPQGVDEAWSRKHFLGTPVPAASLATVNLAHIAAAVEFVSAEFAEFSNDRSVPGPDEVEPEKEPVVTDVESKD